MIYTSKRTSRNDVVYNPRTHLNYTITLILKKIRKPNNEVDEIFQGFYDGRSICKDEFIF